MLTSEKLVTLQGKSNRAISAMESVVEKLNALIIRAEADPSRSRAFVVESVQAERDKVLPALAEQLAIIKATATETERHKKFWESRPLLLSLQTFEPDPAKDATIKMGYATSLATMPAALLQLTLDDARGDANLPLIYQCWRAGVARSNESGFTDAVNLGLDGIEIPGQAVSLAAISTCWSNQSHGETIFSAATGLRGDPVRRITVAREQEVTSRLVSAAEARTA